MVVWCGRVTAGRAYRVLRAMRGGGVAMTDTDTTTTGTDWTAWQRSWDRQQEWYMPDREERFRIMLDMVEGLVGTAPRVLDLACGTGSITARLLARFPEA